VGCKSQCIFWSSDHGRRKCSITFQRTISSNCACGCSEHSSARLAYTGMPLAPQRCFVPRGQAQSPLGKAEVKGDSRKRSPPQP